MGLHIIRLLATRYSTENYQCSGTFGLSGIHLCYYQRASKQLQLGVELEANPRMQEAVASIGYQVDLPKSDVVFKGMFETFANNQYQQFVYFCRSHRFKLVCGCSVGKEIKSSSFHFSV